jgi:hypothetical protein
VAVREFHSIACFFLFFFLLFFYLKIQMFSVPKLYNLALFEASSSGQHASSSHGTATVRAADENEDVDVDVDEDADAEAEEAVT